MKQNILLLAALFSSVLTGCGGGGGGSPSGAPSSSTGPTVIPPAFIQRFATGVSFLSPKHMALVGTNLYVADRTVNGLVSGRIAKIDTASQALLTATTVSNPFGVALKSTDVYYTATDASGFQGIYLMGNGSSVVALSNSNNFGGLAFYSNTKLYAANSSAVLVYPSSGNFNTSTVNIALSSPTALTMDVNKTLVYASLGDNTVVSINPSNDATTVLTQSSPVRWGPLMQPQGIAVSTNGYAYVVSQGDVHGDGGYISKVDTSTGVTEVLVSDTVGDWGSVPVGFCQATGVAIDANNEYLYVSNGNTCTNVVHHQNHDQILKIKLP